MSDGNQKMIVGLPVPGGDIWKFTRRAADSLDAAKPKILNDADAEEPAQTEEEGADISAGSEEE